MADDLDKLINRLQALRAKTIANGCTEEEALSAAAKVAELLDRHRGRPLVGNQYRRHLQIPHFPPCQHG